MLIHVNKDFENPKRLVVLGGNGFVGEALSEKIEQDDVEVLSLSSRDLDLTKDGSKKQLSSILKDGDSLVILSALTPDRGKDINTFMLNLKMIEHVCGAIEKHNLAHVVYFSSDAVYPLATTRINEQSLAAPTDLYGSMHLAREVMIQSIIGDIPFCTLRPTLIYGSKDTHNSYGPNRFRRQAKEGKIVIGGEGEETRDHISVNDVVGIVREILGYRSKGILNLATGNSYSFYEVAKLVAEQFTPSAIVETTERKSPITHRSFDITNLIKAFPSIEFTSLEAGVQQAHLECIDNNG